MDRRSDIPAYSLTCPPKEHWNRVAPARLLRVIDDLAQGARMPDVNEHSGIAVLGSMSFGHEGGL
jgi:hypothetical protein